jgi:hypothetical protein
MTIWELRFTDGRGASFYTTSDVTEIIGKSEAVRTFPVASDVSKENALWDAKACFAEGRTVELTAHLGAVAYAVRHELENAASE